jgi:hypothetical protein
MLAHITMEEIPFVLTVGLSGLVGGAIAFVLARRA